MSSSLHRTGTLLGLVLVLWGGLSWGQLPPTNDTSDGTNTGGGTGALGSNTTGTGNTAYGAEALDFSNTTGTQHRLRRDALSATPGASQHRQRRRRAPATPRALRTPPAAPARSHNTTGFDNTASGAGALRATPRASTTPPAAPTRSRQHHGRSQHRQRRQRAPEQHHGRRQHCARLRGRPQSDGRQRQHLPRPPRGGHRIQHHALGRGPDSHVHRRRGRHADQRRGGAGVHHQYGTARRPALLRPLQARHRTPGRAPPGAGPAAACDLSLYGRTRRGRGSTA